MDKFEYQAKLEEINKLVEKEDYEEAVAIADTIEWKRVRSVRTLCMISEIYEAVGRMDDSKGILFRAYRRSPNSRQILYRLTEVCVQTQEFDDAVEYYTEYVNLAPHDNNKYILKYEIYKGRGSSVEEQIQVLEELKSREYTEQWAYELAKLYDEAGMADKCVAECDDLALWFHNGRYVVQALELKKKYVPLTPEQQTIYENPSSIVDMETKEAAIEAAVPTLDEEIMKELPKSEKEVIADSILMNTEKEIAAAVSEHKEDTKTREDVREDVRNTAGAEERKEAQKPENIKPVKGFDTVGLQNELASSMRKILEGMKPAVPVPDLEEAPVLEPVAATREEEPEEIIQGQMHIDDLLTGDIPEESAESAENEKDEQKKALEQDILTAATINISERIKKEIGNKDLRAYAAEQRRKPAPTAEPEAVQPVARAEEPKAVQPQVVRAEEPQAAQAAEPEAVQPQVVRVEEPQAAQAAEPESVQPQGVQTEEPETADPDPMSYTRSGLDEKERQMLGFWSSIRGMNEQVNVAVTQMMRSIMADKTSSRGNVILVGDAGNGRTTLALSIAKIIGRCKGLQRAKVAKIYAEDLNNKDIAATVSKIAGGVLIIEEAGDLSDNAIAQLSMAMDFKTDGLIVFLEDERRYLQDLLARNTQFAQKFDITINVPMLTKDELVEFGKYYALENDCVMDDSAVLTLYDGIGVMQTPEQPVAILDVKEVMDKAIKRANKFSLGKIFSTISGKRFDEEDRVIIKGKNFKKIK